MKNTIEVKDGSVLRDGEAVGAIDATGAFLPKEGLHHKIVAAIKKHFAEKPAGDVSKNPPSEFHDDATAAKPVKQPKASAEIPPEPEQDPRYGDKTPAYVDWMRNHRPADYAVRYANRKVSAE